MVDLALYIRTYVLNRYHTSNQTRLGIAVILCIFKFHNDNDYIQLLLH